MCPFFPASPTSSPHIYTLSLHDAVPAAVALLAALPVLSRLFEAALVSLFVDFGAAVFVTAAHDKDIGLFAAHQTVEHFVHQPVIDEGLNSWGCFHGDLIPYLSRR